MVEFRSKFTSCFFLLNITLKVTTSSGTFSAGEVLSGSSMETSSVFSETEEQINHE